jgi:MFS family permease
VSEPKAVAVVASGLGPPVGGALVALSSWRLAFLVNLPLGIFAIAVTRRHIVESRSPGIKRRPDLRGAALLAASLALLTLGVIEGPDWGWAGVRIIAVFAASAASLVGFILSSRAVVIQAGNNYIEGEDGTFGHQINQAMHILKGVQRVVWVTVAKKWPSRATIDKAIHAAAHRWSRILVANWAPIAAHHPGYTYDGLHLTPDGRTAMAKLIAQTVGPAPQAH